MIEKCIYCGKEPRIKHQDIDMWYVQCDCGKHQLYEYLGFTRSGAIERWNFGNRPVRKQLKKGKNEDIYE